MLAGLIPSVVSLLGLFLHCLPSVYVCVLNFSSYENRSPIGLGPTLWSPFNLITLLRTLSTNTVNVMNRIVSLRNSCLEAQIHNVTVFGDQGFKEIINVQ